MKKRIKIKDIYKVINQEAKILQGWAKYDKDDNLLVSFSATDIKNALVYDKENKKYVARFKSDFTNNLARLREYAVDGANSLHITITGNPDQAILKTFKKAWDMYFGLKIYRKHEDIKELRKKNWFSLILGLIFTIIVAMASISTIIFDNKGLAIAASAIDTVFGILAWVFVWEFFYDIFYTLKQEKRTLVNLYLMYKAEFIIERKSK